MWRVKFGNSTIERDCGERETEIRGGSVKLIPSELLGPAAALPLKTVFLFFLFSANLLSPLPLSLLPPVPLAISLPSYPF